jgi:ketosteroid isomerase-like protein
VGDAAPHERRQGRLTAAKPSSRQKTDPSAALGGGKNEKKDRSHRELIMTVNTTAQDRNEQEIRRLYALAEGKSKDTPAFVSQFAEGGYFYDVAAGKKYYGKDIGVTVDVYATAFPDMHRELYSLYFSDNVVIVELSLNGTHKGDLVLPAGTIAPTGKEMHAPCCDVFHLTNGKVTSFHCYVAVPILLEQLGVFMNLRAAFRH